MNVLSLFDGISCGQLAFKRLGITFGNEIESNCYLASEVNKYAISVTKKNFPNTIEIGDVRNIHYENGVLYKNCEYKSEQWCLGEKIANVNFDYLIGGSPCQNFSFAGKMNGMSTKTNEKITTLKRYLELKDQNYEFDGYSYLFWEYVRLLNEIKPKYFLLENVRMKKEWREVIDSVLRIEPIEINSALVSAQSRKRLYWIGKKNKNNNYEKIEIPQPLDRGLIIKDILDYGNLKNEYVPYGVDKRYKRYFDKYNNIPQHFCAYSNKDVSTKTPTITTHSGSGSGSGAVTSILPICINSKSGRNGITGLYATNEVPLYEVKNGMIKINDNTFPIKLDDGYYIIRKLSPLECERLQTLDDNYTDCVSNNQRYKAIGNGWTVDVIKHILSYTL
jgi:DNA-cytosine methyltransferase